MCSTYWLRISCPYESCGTFSLSLLSFPYVSEIERQIHPSLCIHLWQTGFNRKSREAYEQSGQIASEAISNIRTVHSLKAHQQFVSDYKHSLEGPNQQTQRAALSGALAFGFGESMKMFIWAMAFYYGSEQMIDQHCEMNEMMRAITGTLFGAASLGQISSLLPDFAKAKIAAASIFTLVDRQPQIDSFSSQGERPSRMEGSVQFKNVHFHYPTRPGIEIFQVFSP